jgi:hypothetical protein
MPVPFRSSAQLLAKFRIAALVALYTLNAGVPTEPVVDPVRMMEPPARISASAFCTAKAALHNLYNVEIFELENVSSFGVGQM